MADTYRYIGKVTPRIDGVEIVTGGAKYLDDIKFPDLLYGKVLRSPHPHALIKKIDKAKAEALKGVKAVLTWEDVPDWKAGTPPIFRILSNKVRYVGDAVALVAAETKEIAEHATRLIDVEYEILPAVFDVEEALKPGAPQLYDELPGNALPGREPIFGPKNLSELVMGDVEKGLSEADVVAEGTFGYEGIPNPLPPESPGGNSSLGGTKQGDGLGLDPGCEPVQNDTLRDHETQSGGENHRQPLWRWLRIKGHVLAGPVLCNHLEQGNQKACQGYIYQK